MQSDVARRNRRALLGALALDNLGSGLFLPLTLVFLHRVGGLPVDVAGGAVAVGTLLGVAAPPLAGRVVDSAGPRRVLVTSLLLQAAGTLGYLLVRGPGAVAVAAALVAVGTQSFYSSLFALVADVEGPGPQDTAFARVAQVRAGAFGTGALLSAGLLALDGDDGLRAAAVVDAATFLLAAIWLVRAVHPPAHAPAAAGPVPATARRTVTADRPFLALVVVAGCAALGGDVFLVGLPVYALEDLSTPGWVPGSCVALLTAVTALGGTAAVRATAARRRSSVLAWGAGLSVVWALVALLALAVPRAAAPVLLLSGTAVEAAATLLTSRVNAHAVAVAPPEHRGRYLAAFQLAYTSAALLAPAVVGLSAHGAGLPWAVVAGTSAVAAALHPRIGSALAARSPDGTAGHTAP